MENKVIIGTFFALCAALQNASIGIISLLLINSGLESEQIAFLKTLVAYLFVVLLLIKTPNIIQKNHINNAKSKNKLFIEVAICSFLGIFILFFFETIAYSYGSPPNVVIILMASATISALFFCALILKEKISISSIIGAILAIIGIFIISWKGSTSSLLLLNASFAGIGYGLFSVLIKKFKLTGGIYLTKYLLMFGTVYLFFPFIVKFNFNYKIDINILLGIVFLALFPTILGFYCTTKALKYMSLGKVQVTELSEPIFSTLLTIIIFNSMPNNSFYIGTLFIILGIVLINELFKNLYFKIIKRTYKKH